MLTYIKPPHHGLLPGMTYFSKKVPSQLTVTCCHMTSTLIHGLSVCRSVIEEIPFYLISQARLSVDLVDHGGRKECVDDAIDAFVTYLSHCFVVQLKRSITYENFVQHNTIWQQQVILMIIMVVVVVVAKSHHHHRHSGHHLTRDSNQIQCQL